METVSVFFLLYTGFVFTKYLFLVGSSKGFFSPVLTLNKKEILPSWPFHLDEFKFQLLGD